MIAPTGCTSLRTEDRKTLKQRVILHGGLKAKIRWQAVVEVLRRRSKTKERSDEGVHEGEPIAFLRKVTSSERRYQESLEDPNAYGVALPWVGFDCEKHPPGMFWRACEPSLRVTRRGDHWSSVLKKTKFLKSGRFPLPKLKKDSLRRGTPSGIF